MTHPHSLPALHLQFKFLNGFELSLGEKRILLHNKKSAAIMAYLILNGNLSESREHIASIFWSESDASHARASLRQSLKQLKDVLEKNGLGGFIAGKRTHIVFNTRDFDVDLWKLMDQLQAGLICEALATGAISAERILSGFEDIDREFSAWLTVYRQRWHKQILEALERIIRTAPPYAPLQIQACDSLLHIDQTHEEAHRILIEWHARRGNTASALRQYNALWELLQADYDTEPSDETQELIVRIKSGAFEADQKPQTILLTPRPFTIPLPETLQVMPDPLPKGGSPLPIIQVCLLESQMPAEFDPAIASGFRTALIACLARFREWIIIDGSPTAPSSQGSSLPRFQESDYQLTVNFTQLISKTVILVTLTETSLGRVLWSDSLPFSLETWLKNERDIAQKVAATLNVYISADGLTRQISNRNISLRPYVQWLQAQYLLGDWSPASETRAEQIFLKIIQEWPEFAPSYSGLANVYNSRHIIFPGVFRDKELEAHSLQLAQKAAELDPLDARTQLTLAWSYLLSGRYAQSENRAELALNLNSSNAPMMISAATIFSYLGLSARAQSLVDQVLSFNQMIPSSYWIHLTEIRFILGDCAGALEAVSCIPHATAFVLGWEAAARNAYGHKEEARRVSQRFLEIARETWQRQEQPEREHVLSWFLSAFPFRQEEVHKRLAENLREACGEEKDKL